MSKFTPCLSRNRQKIKKLSILTNLLKKASTQTKPENFKSVCGQIIIYDSKKTCKDFDIFSAMYKKCKKKKNSYHHLSSYFSILHAVFQRVNHTQNLLINNEKS